MKKIKLVITSGYDWTYVQWFILGFYKLAANNEIEFSIKLPFLQKFMFSKFIGKSKNLSVFLRKYINKNKYNKTGFNMQGYIITEENEKKKFCIDCLDSPFLFNSNDLMETDCYFKMQYPICLYEDSFKLTNKINIPWLDHITCEEGQGWNNGIHKKIKNFKNLKHKIKPLMVGPRKLADNNDYDSLNKGYKNYISSFSVKKEKMIMCYFGNALGPVASSDIKSPDFNKEADIMGIYKGKIEHPNVKRAKAAKYLKNCFNFDADTRIINQGNADTKRGKNNKLIIPLSEFCLHISKFYYNLNISGYRLSIPNRFIESFMAGTAILTDELMVRWYKPFDSEEVVETVKMGYCLDSEIDWQGFRNDLERLKPSNPILINKCLKEKWTPEVVSRYIIDTVKRS